MGNAGSNQPVSHHHGNVASREHRRNKDHPPPSPGKEGQAFVFDKKPSLLFHSSQEEEESYFTKVTSKNIELIYIYLHMYKCYIIYDLIWI